MYLQKEVPFSDADLLVRVRTDTRESKQSELISALIDGAVSVLVPSQEGMKVVRWKELERKTIWVDRPWSVAAIRSPTDAGDVFCRDINRYAGGFTAVEFPEAKAVELSIGDLRREELMDVLTREAVFVTRDEIDRLWPLRTTRKQKAHPASPPMKRGRTSKADWGAFEERVFELFDEHGAPGFDAPGWENKAAVGRIMRSWLESQGIDVGDSTLREHVSLALRKAEERKRGN